MTPYYEHAGITIYHGDCRDILPELDSSAAIVADPPYGLGDKWEGGGGKGKSSWKFNPSEARSWDGHTIDGFESLVSPFSEIIVWGGNYYNLPASRCWLVWDKKQNDEWTTGQCELAWTNLDKPVRAFRFAQCEQASEGPKLHPTQKPHALMVWCLKWLTSPLIIDPCAGGGTTLVAAKNLGRRAVGIEIEERYCEIACRRLEQEVFSFTPNSSSQDESANADASLF